MKTVFVADPVASLDPAVDTTHGLMAAALACGADVWATTVHDLEGSGCAAVRLRLARG